MRDMNQIDYMEIFNDSYEAMTSTREQSEAFFKLFYDKFLERSPVVRSKFEHTDFEHQIRMLRSSLSYMMNFFVTKKNNEQLFRVATRHSRSQLGIEPELYGVWIEAMVETLLELYPEFDRNVELAWRIVLAPGIELMKFYYDP